MASHITRPFAVCGQGDRMKPSLPKGRQMCSRFIKKGSSHLEGRRRRSDGHVYVSRMQPELRRSLHLRCSSSGQFFLQATRYAHGRVDLWKGCRSTATLDDFLPQQAAQRARKERKEAMASSQKGTQRLDEQTMTYMRDTGRAGTALPLSLPPDGPVARMEGEETEG
jgi:hypothetical protein